MWRRAGWGWQAARERPCGQPERQPGPGVPRAHSGLLRASGWDGGSCRGEARQDQRFLGSEMKSPGAVRGARAGRRRAEVHQRARAA